MANYLSKVKIIIFVLMFAEEPDEHYNINIHYQPSNNTHHCRAQLYQSTVIQRDGQCYPTYYEQPSDILACFLKCGWTVIVIES